MISLNTAIHDTVTLPHFGPGIVQAFRTRMEEGKPHLYAIVKFKDRSAYVPCDSIQVRQFRRFK